MYLIQVKCVNYIIKKPFTHDHTSKIIYLISIVYEIKSTDTDRQVLITCSGYLKMLPKNT